MEITRVGSQASAKGPQDWFTGTVRIPAGTSWDGARKAASGCCTSSRGGPCRTVGWRASTGDSVMTAWTQIGS